MQRHTNYGFAASGHDDPSRYPQRHPYGDEAPPPPPEEPQQPGRLRRAWGFVCSFATIEVLNCLHLTGTVAVLSFLVGQRLMEDWPSCDTDKFLGLLTAAAGSARGEPVGGAIDGAALADATLTIVVPTAPMAPSPFQHPLVHVPPARTIPEATKQRLRRALSVAAAATGTVGRHARGAPVELIIVGGDAVAAGAWLAAHYRPSDAAGASEARLPFFGEEIEVPKVPLNATGANATTKHRAAGTNHSSSSSSSSNSSAKHAPVRWCTADVHVRAPLLSGGGDADDALGSALWPFGEFDFDPEKDDAATAEAIIPLRVRMSASGIPSLRGRGCKSERACLRRVASFIAAVKSDHDGAGDVEEGAAEAGGYRLVATVSSWYHVGFLRKQSASMLRAAVGANVKKAHEQRAAARPQERQHASANASAAFVNGTAVSRPPVVTDRALLFYIASSTDETELHLPPAGGWAALGFEVTRSKAPPPVARDAVRPSPDAAPFAQHPAGADVIPSPNDTPTSQDHDSASASSAHSDTESALLPVCSTRGGGFDTSVAIRPHWMEALVPAAATSLAHTIAVTWLSWAEGAWQTAAAAAPLRVPYLLYYSLGLGDS